MRKLFSLLLLVSATALAKPSPEQVVLDGVYDVIDVVQEYSASDANSEAFLSAVDEVLADKVAFTRIVYGVMGDYWSQASRAQRIAFYKEFRKSMVNTYARAIMQFSDLDVRLAEDQSSDQDSDANTQVFIEAVANDGSTYFMTQSVFYDQEDQAWQLQNITVNGINMGNFFRRQFDALIRETDGDLDLAIERWAQKAQAEYEETSFRDG